MALAYRSYRIAALRRLPSAQNPVGVSSSNSSIVRLKSYFAHAHKSTQLSGGRSILSSSPLTRLGWQLHPSLALSEPFRTLPVLLGSTTQRWRRIESAGTRG